MRQYFSVFLKPSAAILHITNYRLLQVFILLSCLGLVTGCWQDNQDQEENDGGLRTPPDVTFDNTSIITGYTMPAASSTIQSDDVTLTIRPPTAAANITLAIAGNNRASVINIRPGAGSITFNVKGNSATPANMPNGDTFVEARQGTRVLARANVIVVIPSGIGMPHPTFNSRVTGNNMIIDASSSPAFFGPLSPDRVKLGTTYITLLSVPVDDQFGARLNSIYANTPVTEQQGFAINQNIQANGTYLDPVGLLVPRPLPEVPREDPLGTANPMLAAHLAAAPAPPPPINFDENQNKLIQVGGHMLNPAISNRRVRVTPVAGSNNQAQLIVRWP